MPIKREFLEELENWTGQEVDIFLVSGQKLDNVTLTKVDEGIVIAKTKTITYLLPPSRIDYIKRSG
ncbi:MAG: hypothetical protein GWO20_19155 [Candidatus Korarchaeota archaeon]|nr:hypothetical protein [Candidatus Korarchaeota archaeon]NIU85375.1 hypothetical protein [Candidatus Thorarchaeota archaeon]NIW15473.1 hypothetical protein [Candidatus Thorarchaeota archaeon]NIW53417.1 hypothetical protein [Candidatus Korarchaeota archaeon]